MFEGIRIPQLFMYSYNIDCDLCLDPFLILGTIIFSARSTRRVQVVLHVLAVSCHQLSSCPNMTVRLNDLLVPLC